MYSYTFCIVSESQRTDLCHMVYEEEEKIQLPAVTVCMRKNLLIREELLHHFSRRELENRYSHLEDSGIDNYLNNLTIKEQFNSIYTAQEVFNNSCEVMKSIAFDSTAFIIDCELISPIRQTISYYSSCFTFFSQLFINYAIISSIFQIIFNNNAYNKT